VTVASSGNPDAAMQRRRSLIEPAPVEYQAAVERFLADASLSVASRRVYRISLTGWAWPLVDRKAPTGQQRRGATAPLVPLALLDESETAGRIASAVAARSRDADARTVSRELSALRSAVAWWQDQGWINRDPTTGLRLPAVAARAVVPLTDQQLAALFSARASLREQALWQLLYDTGASAGTVLALDADAVSRSGQPGRSALPTVGQAGWSERSADLLSWLLSGRRIGPLFLTTRRTASRAAGSDICPLTRQVRMSYRRAAEIFTQTTSRLDPEGRGWTLHQLRKPDRQVLTDL
jgi:hypothetical protein